MTVPTNIRSPHTNLPTSPQLHQPRISHVHPRPSPLVGVLAGRPSEPAFQRLRHAIPLQGRPSFTLHAGTIADAHTCADGHDWRPARYDRLPPVASSQGGKSRQTGMGAKRRPRPGLDGQGTARTYLPRPSTGHLNSSTDGNPYERPCPPGCHDLREWLPGIGAPYLTCPTSAGRPQFHWARRHELPLAPEQLVGGRRGRSQRALGHLLPWLTVSISFRTRPARCWPSSGRHARLAAPTAKSTPSSSKPLAENLKSFR
jgi:hypothetical protein